MYYECSTVSSHLVFISTTDLCDIESSFISSIFFAKSLLFCGCNKLKQVAVVQIDMADDDLKQPPQLGTITIRN